MWVNMLSDDDFVGSGPAHAFQLGVLITRPTTEKLNTFVFAVALCFHRRAFLLSLHAFPALYKKEEKRK